MEPLFVLFPLRILPRQIDPSAACSVTSAQIEQCYNRNQRGVMEFYTAKYTYRLDFSGEVIAQRTFSPLNLSDSDSYRALFPHSYAADKRNNGEAAAYQALPSLRHRFQVRSKLHNVLQVREVT